MQIRIHLNAFLSTIHPQCNAGLNICGHHRWMPQVGWQTNSAQFIFLFSSLHAPSSCGEAATTMKGQYRGNYICDGAWDLEKSTPHSNRQEAQKQTFTTNSDNTATMLERFNETKINLRHRVDSDNGRYRLRKWILKTLLHTFVQSSVFGGIPTLLALRLKQMHALRYSRGLWFPDTCC